MYKNKFDTRNNIAGINIRKLRLSYKEHLSQRALASKMQLPESILTKMLFSVLNPARDLLQILS